MITSPEIDPTAISFGPFHFNDMVFGPLQIQWYSVSYLLAFATAWILAIRHSDKDWAPVKQHQIEDLMLYGMWGVILGGRIGYMIFYNLDHWVADPTLVLRLWEGGMSFHGGLIGVLISTFMVAKKLQIPFLSLTDFIAPLVPTGLLYGRLANFVNQELWGRASDVPWAMIFPADPTKTPRHPSQLYEALGEGILLFLILSWFARKPRLKGEVSGLFLLLYGTVRFLIEFVRQPDTQFRDAEAILEIFNWMTRGQWLCVPMMIGGLWLIRRTIWSGFEESADGNESQ